jgi:hypothetical protein
VTSTEYDDYTITITDDTCSAETVTVRKLSQRTSFPDAGHLFRGPSTSIKQPAFLRTSTTNIL